MIHALFCSDALDSLSNTVNVKTVSSQTVSPERLLCCLFPQHPTTELQTFTHMNKCCVTVRQPLYSFYFLQLLNALDNIPLHSEFAAVWFLEHTAQCTHRDMNPISL